MFAYTLTPTSLNVLFKGRMRTLHNSAPNFTRAVEIIKLCGQPSVKIEDYTTELEQILDIRSFLAKITSGRVQIADAEVRIDGRPVSGYVVERTLALLKAGFDVTPMARFMDRLQNNPTHDVREDLWKWLENGNMPLTPDGKFIAFKKVRDDYLSDHDGTTLHVIGQYMSMPRAACDDNRNNTCSRGLHFCSYEYLGDYSGRSGRVLILEIDPADVVAIPTDYKLSKGRACGYTPIGEVPHEEALRFFDGSMPVYTPPPPDDVLENELGIDAPYDQYDECADCGYDADECHCEPDDEITDIAQPENLTVVHDDKVATVPLDAVSDPVETTEDVNLRDLKRVLDGDVWLLDNAFYWNSSPKGTDYWLERQMGIKAISPDDHKWLTRLYDYNWNKLNNAMTPASWIDAMRRD